MRGRRLYHEASTPGGSGDGASPIGRRIPSPPVRGAAGVQDGVDFSSGRSTRTTSCGAWLTSDVRRQKVAASSRTRWRGGAPKQRRRQVAERGRPTSAARSATRSKSDRWYVFTKRTAAPSHHAGPRARRRRHLLVACPRTGAAMLLARASALGASQARRARASEPRAHAAQPQRAPARRRPITRRRRQGAAAAAPAGGGGGVLAHPAAAAGARVTNREVPALALPSMSGRGRRRLRRRTPVVNGKGHGALRGGVGGARGAQQPAWRSRGAEKPQIERAARQRRRTPSRRAFARRGGRM